MSYLVHDIRFQKHDILSLGVLEWDDGRRYDGGLGAQFGWECPATGIQTLEVSVANDVSFKNFSRTGIITLKPWEASTARNWKEHTIFIHFCIYLLQVWLSIIHRRNTRCTSLPRFVNNKFHGASVPIPQLDISDTQSFYLFHLRPFLGTSASTIWFV